MREPTRLEAADLLAIEAQDSQKLWLGIEGTPDWDSAHALAEQDVAWCARRDDGSLLACFGINETFPGAQGVAWALLSQPIGKDHLALTRFIRGVVEACELRRLELFAKSVPIEDTRAFFRKHGAPVDSGVLVALAMSKPTPECRWAVMLGFEPVHVMRRFGFDDEAMMLFERIL